MSNVVLIVADQLRADVAYHEHYSFVRTPTIDRLRREGITCTNAFCQYPICGPSRASIVTGRYPQQHGVLNNRCMLPDGERTLGHHFGDCGYDAVAFGKTHGQNPGFRRLPEPLPLRTTLGDDLWGFYRGQDMLSVHQPRRGPPVPLLGVFDAPIEAHYDHVVNEQVRQFMIERDTERPFLLWVGYHTPHPPLFPPRHVADLYPPEQIELPTVPESERTTKPAMQNGPARLWRQTSADTRRQMIAAYLALVTHVDECMADLLEILERSDVLDDTAVVFIADHGEQLGEHDMIGKLNSFYEGSLRVPMVFRLPGAAHGGSELQQLVELTDLYPTVCDVAGVGTPVTVRGTSLAPLFGRPDPAHRAHVNAMLVDSQASTISAVGSRDGVPRGQMVRTDRWKLAVYAGDRGELYDLRSDPGERVNLFDDAAHAARKLDLYQLMVEHMLTNTRDATGYGYNLFPG